jgi:hypothetical protein
MVLAVPVCLAAATCPLERTLRTLKAIAAAL